ncbi:Serine-threonine/tyrosine-protein kinase, catalytic domain [Dillenia turbinata]|uniref:Serine-threonine/tyrosine-protein kinase, catalytic domain n=1 Tax=Dillenia turbinata TaxID=194707 RepID=A0AAN8V7F6_9MAGN
MSEEAAQKVVVVQDASRDVSMSAVRWILPRLSLKPGDELMLLGVLHQVNNPSTFSFMGAGQRLGYKTNVGSSNPKVVEEEVARKKEEYTKNEEIIQLTQQYQNEKCRQMKKDKRYFMEKLECKISRLKRDNKIEELRGPRQNVQTRVSVIRSSGNRIHVRYNEMIPGSEDDETSPRSNTFSKSSSSEKLQYTTTASSSSFANTDTLSYNFGESKHSLLPFSEDFITNMEKETAGDRSLFTTNECPLEILGMQLERQNIDDVLTGGLQPEDVFGDSFCSICKNRPPKIGWKKDFTYAELEAATDKFSKNNFLSEGGFGSVYWGELKNGLKIAVKQHKNASSQGEKEFKAEVDVLSKARHENLVMLLGSCSEGSNRLLVYEFVCNGSLDQHLSNRSQQNLSWDRRIKIALGAAKGLKYLHDNKIIHRDMRPNNILVTHDHESLLGDFGLARTQHEDSDHSSETRVVGTLGYVAPEYAESGRISTKTDVYAFGVVLLQLITGLRTTDKILGGKSLVGWARPLLEERNYPDLLDQRIADSHDMHQLFWMVQVAEKCLSKDPQNRLSMDKVFLAFGTEAKKFLSIKRLIS